MRTKVRKGKFERKKEERKDENEAKWGKRNSCFGIPQFSLAESFVTGFVIKRGRYDEKVTGGLLVVWAAQGPYYLLRTRERRVKLRILSG